MKILTLFLWRIIFEEYWYLFGCIRERELFRPSKMPWLPPWFEKQRSRHVLSRIARHVGQGGKHWTTDIKSCMASETSTSRVATVTSANNSISNKSHSYGQCRQNWQVFDQASLSVGRNLQRGVLHEGRTHNEAFFKGSYDLFKSRWVTEESS